MKYSVDWANKKKYQIYDIKTNSYKSIAPIQDAFIEFFDNLSGNHSFYLEWGGGDIFKLLALRYGHKVFCVPGKKIKEYREGLGKKRNKEIKKTDENDARLIRRYAKKHPEEFYEFKEDDKRTLIISILSKELNKNTEDSIRKQNQLIAFERTLELTISEKSKIKKMLEQKKKVIEEIKTDIKMQKRELQRALKNHPLWVGYLKEVSGIGEVAAGKIIGSIKRFSRFSNKYSLRHFAGMITKKDNHIYNRQLKQALYMFTEQVIKQKIRPWRQVYDSRKKDYAKKHPDWSKGKINAYTKKFVQTYFLNDLWNEGKMIENG